MILPITAYGHPVLKKVAEEIGADYPNLEELIADMFETMYAANGIGLAAPQINRSIRLFIVDATSMADDFPELAAFKKVFINPYILDQTGAMNTIEEGCLSIPNIRENVDRQESVVIEYYDETWNFHEDTFTGMAARIIQHEHDHLEGKLFVERISALRKTIIKRKLLDISQGKAKVDYRMLLPAQKKVRVS
jgi:peptide deformylase